MFVIELKDDKGHYVDVKGKVKSKKIKLGCCKDYMNAQTAVKMIKSILYKTLDEANNRIEIQIKETDELLDRSYNELCSGILKAVLPDDMIEDAIADTDKFKKWANRNALSEDKFSRVRWKGGAYFRNHEQFKEFTGTDYESIEHGSVIHIDNSNYVVDVFGVLFVLIPLTDRYEKYRKYRKLGEYNKIVKKPAKKKTEEKK